MAPKKRMTAKTTPLPVPEKSSSGGAKLARTDVLSKSLWCKSHPQYCKSCEQTTHDIDRDSIGVCPEFPDGWILEWMKTNTTAKLGITPTGAECYKCYAKCQKWT